MPASNYAIEDAPTSSNYSIEDAATPSREELQATKQRMAQPTEFEKARANESNTPWTDIGKGLGESVLSTIAPVSRAIHRIPGIGETLAPSAGIGAMQQLATPRTPGEQLGATEGNTLQLAAVPWSRMAEAAAPVLKPVLGPAARYAEENIMPTIRNIPVVGKALESVEGAPSLVKAATRGAASGAVAGAGPGIYHLNPEQAAEGALYGAGIGGLAGTGAYGLAKFAGDVPKGIPAVSSEPFALEREAAVQEPAVQQPLNFPKEETPPTTNLRGNPITRMGNLIEQGAGWKPLEWNQPIGAQSKYPGPVSFRHGPEMQTPEIGGGRMVRGEPIAGQAERSKVIPQIVPEEVGRQMGVGPIEMNKPFREQLNPNPEAPPSAQVELEKKYPDKAVRQLVHANGPEIVDAIGTDKPELLKQVHDLTNPDVRQALINSGEDMGQVSVGNRKATGNQISRQDAFRRLLAKGHSPERIVELAKPPEEKPGPARGGSSSEEKTGT